MKLKVTLLAVAVACLSVNATAQSTYSMPNPLIKPVQYTKAGAMPAAQPVPLADSPNPPSPVPPLPPSVSAASLPGQATYGSAPSNETVIRDTLATFTVTAIVGNRAVLRNNVGAMMAPVGGGGNSSSRSADPSQQANGSTLAPLARQAVIRVKSDVPVYVAGVELTPLVQDSRVEFRVAGRKQVVATVTLESQSSYGYVPQQTAREVADPAVSARVSPALPNSANGTRPSSDASSTPTLNGTAAAPR